MLFISFQNPDKQDARAFAEGLRRHGVHVWCTAIPGTIQKGKKSDPEVEAAIQRSRGFVIITSRKITSDWVLGEIDLALERAKSTPLEIVPVLFTGAGRSTLPISIRTRELLELEDSPSTAKEKRFATWAAQLIEIFPDCRLAVDNKIETLPPPRGTRRRTILLSAILTAMLGGLGVAGFDAWKVIAKTRSTEPSGGSDASVKSHRTHVAPAPGSWSRNNRAAASTYAALRQLEELSDDFEDAYDLRLDALKSSASATSGVSNDVQALAKDLQVTVLAKQIDGILTTELNGERVDSSPRPIARLKETLTEPGATVAMLASTVDEFYEFVEKKADDQAGAKADAKRLHDTPSETSPIDPRVEAPTTAWDGVRARLAADARFSRVALVDQEGLVPLGVNPASQLEEFAVEGTGSLPTRSATGTLQTEDDVAIVLVLVPPGAFQMGSPDGVGDSDEHPQHQVTFDSPFFIARTELTEAQAHRLHGRWEVTGRGTSPATTLSWEELESTMLPNGLRLPSEAEWEYACRAGTPTTYSFGDDAARLGEYAWYGGDSDSAHPAGQKKPNAWGLHDMHGNVWEWCEDTYHEDHLGARKDGSAWIGTDSNPGHAGSRVIRGGSFSDPPAFARSAERNGTGSSSGWNGLGFRHARSFTTD